MGKFLDAFKSKRVGILIALGFASGLPLLLSGQTLGAWMTNVGVNLKTIGIFSLVTLPYSLKVFWAPLLDRYSLPWLGRRRGWMALTQLIMAGVILAMSVVDPKATPPTMALFALMLAFFSASHDVVSDAYRTDVLPPNERASGTSTFILGYRLAMLFAGAGAMILSDHLPWSTVYQILAVLMAASVVFTWWAPEPQGILAPRTLADALIRPFAEFFSRRRIGIVFLFVILYKFGEYVTDAMVIPFMIKTGFTNTEIGALRKVIGFFATVSGVIVGGGLVAKFGVRRALLAFGFLQAATNSGYLALAIVGKNYTLLAVAIGVDLFCGGLAAAAFSAYQMSLCHKSFSATQYALLTSASVVAGRLFSASSGYLAEAWGWPKFFASTMVMAIPGMALLFFLPRTDTDSPA